MSQRYIPFAVTALLMCVALYFIYPYYQYYIDPDGTAYLTISKRYAAGDYAKAINGYWSPWSCWLTALLIRLGISAIPASVIINAMGAVGFLWVTNSIAQKLKVNGIFQWLVCVTLAGFLCFAVFYQSFDDLWECFFLLTALRLLLSGQFTIRPAMWFFAGIIGAISYFAKAYSFPFFILNTICCSYFITKGDKGLWMKVCAVTLITMVAFSFPWVWALHNKYGIWTTATAGNLNTSWYLIGHPFWKPEYKSLLPPPYSDSPYYWEDPYFANAATPHFWDSPALAFKQIFRIGQNTLKLLMSMIQISVFFPVISIMLVRFITNRKATNTTSPTFIASLSFLLFPLGYMLINFEQRYIWYMMPVSLIGGMLFFQNHLLAKVQRHISVIIIAAFALSYLIYPVYWLGKHFNDGLVDYELATRLKKNNVTGTFCSNAKPGTETQKMVRLAYFSGCPYYVEPVDSTIPITEMNKYHIAHYFSYCRGGQKANANVTPCFLYNTTNHHSFTIEYTDTISNIQVLKFWK